MPNQLEDVLSQFKDQTADQIAATIKRRGIKGRMGTTYGCPMALLLNGIETGSFVIGRKYIVRRSGKVIQKVRTPREISVFMRKFDLGKYPEIIAPPPRCLRKSRTKSKSGSPSQQVRNRPKEIKNHLAKLVDRFGD